MRELLINFCPGIKEFSLPFLFRESDLAQGKVSFRQESKLMGLFVQDTEQDSVVHSFGCQLQGRLTFYFIVNVLIKAVLPSLPTYRSVSSRCTSSFG